MKKSVLTSARLFVTRPGSFRYRWAMVTLTYRPGVEWFAKQLTAMVNAMKEFLRRRSIKPEYMWVLELTKAGVPHYHLLVRLPKGITLPKPDKRGWWPHGMTRIEWAKNAFGYLAKYASKGTETDEFPKGARLSGVGGLNNAERCERAFWMLPLWVREVMGCPIWLERVKGGFLNPETGEILPSPFICEFIGGVLLVKRKDLISC